MTQNRQDIKASEECYRDRAFVETSCGIAFELLDPKFDIEDIAHALSQTVRYGGHCRSFYSVAEHSCLVAEICHREKLADPFEALMHDATEAYLSDVPAPFKQFLPDWKALDADLEAKLREWAGLSAEHNPGIKHADWLALFIEAYELLPNRGTNFADPQGFRSEALQMREAGECRLLLLAPNPAKEMFLFYYNKYRP